MDSAENLYQFQWPVAQDGYEWVDFGDIRWLKAAVDPYEPPSMLYTPLDDTGLFRTFAETQLTEEAIKDFADRYGQICSPFFERGDDGSVTGVSWPWWAGSISAMRDAITLWELTRERASGKLKRIIQWQKGGSIRCGIGELTHTISIATAQENFQRNELVRPAKFFLQHIVNEHLRHVHSALLWNGSALAMHNIPRDLISALWLQFALAISGDKQYKRCTECQAFFELSPGVNRKDRAYCSNACRSAAYRKRRERKP